MKTVFVFAALLAAVGIVSCHGHQNWKFTSYVPALNRSENLVDNFENNGFNSDLLPSRIYCLTQIQNESFEIFSNRFKEFCRSMVLKNINKNPSPQHLFSLKSILKRISRETNAIPTQYDKNNTTNNDSNNQISTVNQQNPSQSTKLEPAETHALTNSNISITSDNQPKPSQKTKQEVTVTNSTISPTSPPSNSDNFYAKTPIPSNSTNHIKQNNTGTEKMSNEIPLSSFSFDQNIYSFLIVISVLAAIIFSGGVLFVIYKVYLDRFRYTFELESMWRGNEETQL